MNTTSESQKSNNFKLIIFLIIAFVIGFILAWLTLPQQGSGTSIEEITTRHDALSIALVDGKGNTIVYDGEGNRVPPCEDLKLKTAKPCQVRVKVVDGEPKLVDSETGELIEPRFQRRIEKWRFPGSDCELTWEWHAGRLYLVCI